MWGFDKRDNRYFRTTVADAGAKRDLYSTIEYGGNVDHSSVEKRFSEEVESPSASVLHKVLSRRPLTIYDKIVLSRFIQSMHSRVPATIEELERRGPNIAEKTRLAALDRISPISADFTNEQRDRLIEVAGEITHHYGVNMPKEAVLPRESSQVINVLMKMHFIFVKVSSTFAFVTSDNPLTFDKSAKLPISDFSIPLARNLALVGSAVSTLQDLSFVQIDRSSGRTINYRTVANSHRMIYSSSKSAWIAKASKSPIKIEPHIILR